MLKLIVEQHIKNVTDEELTFASEQANINREIAPIMTKDNYIKQIVESINFLRRNNIK